MRSIIKFEGNTIIGSKGGIDIRHDARSATVTLSLPASKSKTVTAIRAAWRVFLSVRAALKSAAA